ncbi:MAG: hypothetical protein ACXAEX_01225 [Promethearchaeota archaeon]
MPLRQIGFLTEKNSDSKINQKNNPLFIPYLSDPNNDTEAPIISFIKPDVNNTVITTRYYEIIVNITDENPPLPGNVSIEVLNFSTSLFNASMLVYEGTLWFFDWDNTSSYINGETYGFKIRAKDSSSSENIGISNELFVILNVYATSSPSLLNGILYIVAVSAIFALLMVYLRKRALVSSPKAKKSR